MTDNEPIEPVPLWERQPWDTDRSYDAFQRYLLQPRSTRSLAGAYRHFVAENRQKTGTKNDIPPTHWRQWYRAETAKGASIPGAIDWPARARAHDDHLDRQERALWEQRQLELRAREWEVGNKLLERAERMLTAVLFRRSIESEDGKSVTTLEPSKWEESDIGRTLKLAFDLQRRAASLPTETVQVNWEQELEKAGIDPKRSLEQAINAVLAGIQKDTSKE